MKPFEYTNKKNMLLSLVALILVVCMLTTITYSWIDSISTISVSSKKDVLTIDSATDSVIKVEAGGATIDLGSFFNKSGNMHLTSCSGDGKDFYFRNIGDDSGYRLGTANDVNVNYISCTFQIESASDTVYYFEDTPVLELKDGDETSDISSYLKCAVTVDDDTVVVTGGEDDVEYQHINDVSGSTKKISVKSASFYKWEKETAAKDDYLFFINAGDTKTVNIKLWLQDPTGELTASNKELHLAMSLMAAENKQVVYFKDATFKADAVNRISSGFSNNDSLKMYLVDDVTQNWTFTKVDGEDNVFKAELPLSYRMQDVYIVRSDNSNSGTLTPEKGGDPIACDFYWKTSVPNAEGLPVTFSVLGNSIYSSGVNATSTGIWKDTEVIYIDDQYGLDLTKVEMSLINNDTSTTETMYYNTSLGYWVGYVVKDSTKLQFTAKNGSTVVGNWGNHSDSKTQVRTTTDSMYVIYDLDKSGDITNIGSWKTYDYWKNQISPYVLEGNFNSWKGTPMLYSDKANEVSYASVEVEKGSYTFKIYSTNSTEWYGKSTTLTFGSSKTVTLSDTLTNTGGNVTATVNHTYGGTLLFTFDSSHKVTVTFIPSEADSGDVRSYVMINNSWDSTWATDINHWETTNSKVTYTERDLTYVGTHTQNVSQVKNYFILNSSGWDTGGTWSNRVASNSKEIFFKPNSNWFEDGARFAAYFFGNGTTWVSMTDDDGDGIYQCEKPDGYPNVIFCRMNGGATANNWDNKWNQTGDLTIPTSTSTVSYTYRLYYTNMDKDATYMQWVNSNGVCRPDKNLNTMGVTDGYNMSNPVNGALYYMTWDDATNGCGKNTAVQTAPTIVASSALSVNSKTTFNATGSNTGTAAFGKNLSYYVKNTDTGTVRVVPATWTPLYAGSYSATARANDGYIITAESAAQKITVS